jgi:peptidoglycan/xylan/chitin deacetylase (PgdA/CDA1 family)
MAQSTSLIQNNLFITRRLVKLIFSIIVWGYDQIKRFFFGLCGKDVPGTCVVLYYHMIEQKERQNFAWQLDGILRNAKLIRADTKNPLIPNTHHIAVTFDDGFVDILANAAPELIKRSIPFTIFVPTGYLGKYPEWIKKKEYRSYRGPVMSEDQLRDIRKLELVTIGSHCVSHTDLRLMDETSAMNEIQSSKNKLENIIGREVKLLSFPHGAYTDKCIEFARQAGYERVFTIKPTLGLLSLNEFITGRISVSPGDWPFEFKLKVLGAYRWLPWAYCLKRKILSVWNWR